MEPSNGGPASSTPALEKRGWFEKVVTSTPVLLTVVATFLVGQSTSEMTRAQYYRSLAGQNQSKVGDQWGFFQAKRIRGQVLAVTAELLRAQSPALFSRDTLTDAANALVQELTAVESGVVAMAKNAASRPVTKDAAQELSLLAVELRAVVGEAEKCAASAKAIFNPPADGWKGERSLLDAASVEAALDALIPRTGTASSDKKNVASVPDPGTTETSMDAAQAALLAEVVADVKRRKFENELSVRVLQLEDAALVSAIKEKDRVADEISQRGKKIENVLEEFDALAERQTALVFAFQRIAGRLKQVLSKSELELSKGNTEFAQLFGRAWLKSASQSIAQVPMQAHSAYKAARNAYSARRYEDDARSNQDSAYLYEVRVHLNSARSDRHLYRSKMFLFAMLVAQAGVTIATLALAVRRRSVFWFLATLAGLIAIGFGTYVYLDLGPMLL